MTCYTFGVVMDLLWVFAAVAPFALGLLFAFAARIDPLSGRWKARRERRDRTRRQKGKFADA
jgi:hypothetical protein